MEKAGRRSLFLAGLMGMLISAVAMTVGLALLVRLHLHVFSVICEREEKAFLKMKALHVHLHLIEVWKILVPRRDKIAIAEAVLCHVAPGDIAPFVSCMCSPYLSE